jgi:hypothetical protein
VIATALVLPFEILLGRRGGAVIVLVTLAAIGQAVSQFVFLAISERRPLFGFQEPGYDPTAIRAAQAAEIATVSFLGAFLVARSLRRRAEARRPPFPTVPREHHGLTFR